MDYVDKSGRSIYHEASLTEQTWEYTAKYNVIYYIIHFHILETAYIFQYTAIYIDNIWLYIDTYKYI